MAKNKQQTTMEVDIYAEVNNVVDVNDLASIAVATHEARLETEERDVVAGITAERKEIDRIEDKFVKDFDDAAKAGLKSSGIDKVAKALSTFLGKNLTTKIDPNGQSEVDDNDMFRVRLLVVDAESEVEFGRFHAINAPKTYKKDLDLRDKVLASITRLQERLGLVRRELRDISKMERRAKAKIATHNLSKVDGGQALLDQLTDDLLGNSSVLALPPVK